MHSHFVPQSHKPLLPNKDTFKHLFSALSKKKVKDAMQFKREVKDKKQRQINEIFESIHMKTQQINMKRDQSIAYWSEQMRMFKEEENRKKHGLHY